MLCTMALVVLVPISASQGSHEDDNVAMIFWDQNEISTYWTGVTNKLDSSINYYAPCVGVYGTSDYGCGANAYKNQYKEYGYGTGSSHSHWLKSKYGTFDYIFR